MHEFDECDFNQMSIFSRIPYSSLSAFLLCLSGITLFFLMIFWSFNSSIEQFRRTFNVMDISWLDKVNLLFIIAATTMVIIGLTLLLLAVLSTGKTRGCIYGREKARRSGQIVSAITIAISYIFLITWILIASLTAVSAFVYTSLSILCTLRAKDNDCLNFNVLSSKNTNLVLCRGEVEQFCAICSSVTIWYYIGFVGCLLICISLIHFITSGSYNYAHISAERKNAEIREILSSELYNFDSINDRNYMTDRNTSLQKIGNMKHVGKNTKGSILPGDLRNPKLMAFRRNSYQNSIWQ